jgi:hypothetical protein
MSLILLRIVNAISAFLTDKRPARRRRTQQGKNTMALS